MSFALIPKHVAVGLSPGPASRPVRLKGRKPVVTAAKFARLRYITEKGSSNEEERGEGSVR
jgi:hypothetical protein